MNVIPGAEERGAVADTLRRLYWDTALSYRDPILRDVVGLDQVLFGSDFPYIRRDLGVNLRPAARANRRAYGERAQAGHER
jgi:6-methylsalicylate decarboxylase